MYDHASFFSGVGGLDLGLERAGWHTVSFSEIDPYASAVLAERWPGVTNLGSITAPDLHRPVGDRSVAIDGGSDDWTRARLWSGGFPCQDLSVAGKRRGMGAGTRSGLAFAFLDLVRVYRPPLILLENVPGLLSSHGGRDMAALLGAMVELGYGVGYRVFDARYFGVPQRRRRVFIVGVTPGGRAGAERAAEVLSVGSRCLRHPPTGIEAGPGAADGAGGSTAHAVRVGTGSGGSWERGDADYVNTLDQRRGGADDNEAQAGQLVATLRVGGRAQGAGSSYDNTPWGLYGAATDSNRVRAADGLAGRVDRDPLGLDSHRYRCCGNGVVSDVSEWIGRQLISVVEASSTVVGLPL